MLVDESKWVLEIFAERKKKSLIRISGHSEMEQKENADKLPNMDALEYKKRSRLRLDYL